MRIFRIPDRHGMIVPFRLNGPQRRYLDERSMFDIIYKARQFGFSSFLELEGTILCARYPEQHAVVIAHDRESTQKLFKRTKFFLEDIARLGISIPYKSYTKNEITFTETNSTFYIGTAGSRKFGRGDTINFLHCSEVAFWPNPVETMGGLVPAARYGRKVIESTANGKGNYFHRQCVQALQSATDIVNDGFEEFVIAPKLHLHLWHEFDEYQIAGNYNAAQLTEEEIELMKNFNLSIPQIAWRRQTMLELPENLLFPQEYPMTFDEGFLASGHSFFPHVKLVPMNVPRSQGKVIYQAPRSGHVYVAGIDMSGGTRRDFSVVEIFDAETMEQVAEFARNDVPPKSFSQMAVDFCLPYKAMVAIEVQFGLIAIDVFKEKYPNALIYKRMKSDKLRWEEKQELYGIYNTDRIKERITSKARGAIDGGAVIHSEFLKDQLESFVEDEAGKLHGESGCHDDAVIAFCLAVEAVSQINLPIRTANTDVINDVFEGWTMKAIRDRVLGIGKKVKHL